MSSTPAQADIGFVVPLACVARSTCAGALAAV